MIAVVVYTNPITEWWFESGAIYWFWGGLATLIGGLLLVYWVSGMYSDWKQRRRNSRRK